MSFLNNMVSSKAVRVLKCLGITIILTLVNTLLAVSSMEFMDHGIALLCRSHSTRLITTLGLNLVLLSLTVIYVLNIIVLQLLILFNALNSTYVLLLFFNHVNSDKRVKNRGSVFGMVLVIILIICMIVSTVLFMIFHDSGSLQMYNSICEYEQNNSYGLIIIYTICIVSNLIEICIIAGNKFKIANLIPEELGVGSREPSEVEKKYMTQSFIEKIYPSSEYILVDEV